MLVAGGRSGVPVLGVPVSSECLCPRSACVLGVPVSSECLSSECLSSECLSFLAFSRTGPPVGGMLVAGGLCRHELVRNGASCGAGKVHRLLRVPPTGSSIPKDDPQGRSPRTIPKDDPQGRSPSAGRPVRRVARAFRPARVPPGRRWNWRVPASTSTSAHRGRCPGECPWRRNPRPTGATLRRPRRPGRPRARQAGRGPAAASERTVGAAEADFGEASRVRTTKWR